MGSCHEPNSPGFSAGGYDIECEGWRSTLMTTASQLFELEFLTVKVVNFYEHRRG